MPKVTKEKGRLYHVTSEGKVMSTKRGVVGKRDEGVTVVREPGDFYFIDGSGDVKRRKR